ncbi:MAG: radical SAM protein [Candidatus Avigastranaerophilus sp.]
MQKNTDIINSIKTLDREQIKQILLFKDEKQEELFAAARKIRNEGKFKDNVELRSVIELSNICAQNCKYCSIGKNGKKTYILSKETVLSRIKMLADLGRRTFLLQSGENRNQKFIDDISFCCSKAIEIYPDIKIILCMGNLSKEQYKQLKESGASRYILKFETSNEQHHKFTRPTDTIQNRLECIQNLTDIGFKVGSGNIVGLPEQTLDNLIDDLILINKLNLSMVSATKFIPNEFSEFKDYPMGDVNITLNFLSVLRILKPDCLIPSTTSLSTGNKDGQLNGLLAGCNTVTIHDGTPKEFEKNFSIYSEKRFSPAEEYCREIIKKANLIPQKYLL